MFLAFLTSFSASGQVVYKELTTNGNFDDGTEYNSYTSNLPTNNGGNWWEGEHRLERNPRDRWNWAPSFTDHTGNNGYMLIADGANWQGHQVWANNFSVVSGRTYTLSFWMRDFWGGGGAAQLYWAVNWGQI